MPYRAIALLISILVIYACSFRVCLRTATWSLHRVNDAVRRHRNDVQAWWSNARCARAFNCCTRVVLVDSVCQLEFRFDMGLYA
jgi:hypothetical protein